MVEKNNSDDNQSEESSQDVVLDEPKSPQFVLQAEHPKAPLIGSQYNFIDLNSQFPDADSIDKYKRIGEFDWIKATITNQLARQHEIEMAKIKNDSDAIKAQDRASARDHQDFQSAMQDRLSQRRYAITGLTILLLVGAYLLAHGQTAAGLAALVTAISAIVGSFFLMGHQKKVEENKS